MNRNESPGKGASLRRVSLQTSLVYGPVSSRRLGKSLGINPIVPGRKVCSFNCIYCQYDAAKPFWPPAEIERWLLADPSQMEARWRKVLMALKERGERIDFVTFAGNGEPTLHPDFPLLVLKVMTLNERLSPWAKTAVLTNGTTLIDGKIREAVGKLDTAIVKLDAASVKSLLHVNRPRAGFEMPLFLQALSELDNLVIQTLFLGGTVTNATEEDLTALIETVKVLRPKEIQVYSLDRVPAVNGIVPLPKTTLVKIAERIREETRLVATVY